MAQRINLVGQRFGMLTVIQLSTRQNASRAYLWECRCDCGNVVYASTGSLRRGDYRSCGCVHDEKRDRGNHQHIKTDTIDGTRKSALVAKIHKANKSGYKGVMWLDERQVWKAYIGFRGKQISLGYFASKVDAIAARERAEEQYHKPYLEGDQRDTQDS